MTKHLPTRSQDVRNDPAEQKRQRGSNQNSPSMYAQPRSLSTTIADAMHGTKSVMRHHGHEQLRVGEPHREESRRRRSLGG
jgi:hypothetical protein